MVPEQDDSRELGLADAIDVVRRELQDAQQRGLGESVQFRLTSVDLELKVEMSSTVQGEGGIQVWVVSVKGGGNRTSLSSHTISVHLEPVTPGGADLVVSDRSSHGIDSGSTGQDDEQRGGGFR